MSKSAVEDLKKPGKYGSARASNGSAHGVEALELIDAGVLLDTVTTVLAAGDAIAIGLTKDGGAVAVTLFSQGEVDKLYAGSQEEIEELLEGVSLTARAGSPI